MLTTRFCHDTLQHVRMWTQIRKFELPGKGAEGVEGGHGQNAFITPVDQALRWCPCRPYMQHTVRMLHGVCWQASYLQSSLYVQALHHILVQQLADKVTQLRRHLRDNNRRNESQSTSLGCKRNPVLAARACFKPPCTRDQPTTHHPAAYTTKPQSYSRQVQRAC